MNTNEERMQAAEAVCNELRDFANEILADETLGRIRQSRINRLLREKCVDVRAAYAMSDREMAASVRCTIPTPHFDLVDYNALFPGDAA